MSRGTPIFILNAVDTNPSSQERAENMQDFDTQTGDDTEANESSERGSYKQRFKEFARFLTKRFVLFISFGPGILGFLWLLGRILKR